MKNPFSASSKREKRLKLFIWGDTGVGKTTLSLLFPKPAVIDLEGGTDWYGGKPDFGFDVIAATSPDEISKAVDYLMFEGHEYKTLVIDPVTVYWEALQKKWSEILLKRNTKSKGFKHEFYDFQPKDWMSIKAELREFLRKITLLDMNVIVTAREKVKYDDGGYMRAVGETFDGEKSLPYVFDTIIRLTVDEKGRRIGQALKDRSNRLPLEPFVCNYESLEKFFGKENLSREAVPVQQEQQSTPPKEDVTRERFSESIEGELERRRLKIRTLCLNKIQGGNNPPKTKEAIAQQATTLLSSFSSNAGCPVSKIEDVANIDQANLILEELEK